MSYSRFRRLTSQLIASALCSFALAAHADATRYLLALSKTDHTLAIVDPARRYTLIDSNNKKVRFVGHAARTLGLANVEPLHARVEDLSPAVSFDTVVARAFAPLPRLLALVRPLCGPQTRVLAMKGARLDEELPGIGADWRLDAVVPLHVPRLEASRSLAILRLSA